MDNLGEWFIPKIDELRGLAGASSDLRMTVGRVLGFDAAVAERSLFRVVVVVSPPILGDLLSRVLERSDIEVETDMDGHSVSAGRYFDVAITSGALPRYIEARSVVRLPDSLGGAGVGRVTTRGREREIELSGLPDLVRLVDRLCPRSEHLPGRGSQ